MRLLRACTAEGQVLDASLDKKVNLAQLQQNQLVVPPEKEYEYVQKHFGFDAAPPSQYAPPTSKHSVQKPTFVREDPHSQLSGSYSDLEYVGAPNSPGGSTLSSRMMEFVQGQMPTYRQAIPKVPAVPVVPVVPVNRQNYPLPSGAMGRPPRAQYTSSDMADHVNPALVQQPSQQVHRAKSSTPRAHQDARSVGSRDSQAHAHAPPATRLHPQALRDVPKPPARNHDSRDYRRRMTHEIPSIDRVPTAFSYTSHDSALDFDEEKSRHSRYTMPSPSAASKKKHDQSAARVHEPAPETVYTHAATTTPDNEVLEEAHEQVQTEVLHEEVVKDNIRKTMSSTSRKKSHQHPSGVQKDAVKATTKPSKSKKINGLIHEWERRHEEERGIRASKESYDGDAIDDHRLEYDNARERAQQRLSRGPLYDEDPKLAQEEAAYRHGHHAGHYGVNGEDFDYRDGWNDGRERAVGRSSSRPRHHHPSRHLRSSPEYDPRYDHAYAIDHPYQEEYGYDQHYENHDPYNTVPKPRDYVTQRDQPPLSPALVAAPMHQMYSKSTSQSTRQESHPPHKEKSKEKKGRGLFGRLRGSKKAQATTAQPQKDKSRSIKSQDSSQQPPPPATSVVIPLSVQQRTAHVPPKSERRSRGQNVAVAPVSGGRAEYGYISPDPWKDNGRAEDIERYYATDEHHQERFRDRERHRSRSSGDDELVRVRSQSKRAPSPFDHYKRPEVPQAYDPAYEYEQEYDPPIDHHHQQPRRRSPDRLDRHDDTHHQRHHLRPERHPRRQQQQPMRVEETKRVYKKYVPPERKTFPPPERTGIADIHYI